MTERTDRWRQGLLGVVLLGSAGGYGWMFLRADALRPSLALLTVVFIGGTALAWYWNRHRIKAHVLTANLALGALLHTAVAGLVVGGERLGALGFIPALESNWHHFTIGLAGLGAAFFAWSRAARRSTSEPVRPLTERPEPAPPPTKALLEPPDWAARSAELQEREDGVRLRQLEALRRLDAVLLDPERSEGERIADAARAIRQEVIRLATESAASEREAESDDVLSQAAGLLEWGAQKIPELADLDVSDLMMGKVVADIRAMHDTVEHRFVDHRELVAIHPIDRPTAEEKCQERVEAALAALPVLEANGMRLSEELIASEPALEAFRSVTGFQVVQLLDGGYVTFEGNGRREAIQRAFGDAHPVEVEVRLFRIDDPEVRRAIDRRVRRVRRWKGMED